MNTQPWRIGAWQELVVLVGLLGMLVPGLSAEPGDEETGAVLRLTLKDCIQRALDNHPSVQEVQWDVAIRRSELQQAQAGYQPTAEFVNLAGW